MSFLPTTIDFLSTKSLLVILAVVALASADMVRRWKHKQTHLLFATILGTVLSLGLIVTVRVFLQPGLQENPYAMAFAVLVVIMAWRALFGPWEVQTKATILGTFLFWITLHLYVTDDGGNHLARLIAALTALVPAVIWCRLFLRYHSERISAVLLMFFSGMLATAPILFYDALVRRGIELQFFLFRLQPESFSQASVTFVSGQLSNPGSVQNMIVSTLISFVIVGLIEELSKAWVVVHSARQLFSSIDDVLQLSIVVAIGFAFAENIINPAYFTAFVEQHLLSGRSPDIMAFLSNVLGRSVLTTMVHVVSTGVMGYFLGLSIFAAPYLEERHAHGKAYRLIAAIHRVLRLREVSIFRVQMMTTGLVSAIAIHGLFNFLVTVPDILPGNPQSFHDLFGPSSPLFLQNIPLLLLPSLLYVVGGFWLLTHLFLKKENMIERGYVVTREVLVRNEEGNA
ncbi:PrsW family intramembrane metalloprotease [Candidatus Peribacteria bacterium]|nr:MAG: PrsW family intramembrane metalloprotease [Candidatus Peribacteria bacterium]